MCLHLPTPPTPAAPPPGPQVRVDTDVVATVALDPAALASVGGPGDAAAEPGDADGTGELASVVALRRSVLCGRILSLGFSRVRLGAFRSGEIAGEGIADLLERLSGGGGG